MYCDKCGSHIAENDVFCNNCGAKIGKINDMPPIYMTKALT